MIDRIHMLDVWVALGGDLHGFETWVDDSRRTPADAWAQLMAAIRGDVRGLMADTNPPAGDLLLELVEARTSSTDWKRDGQ